MNQNADEMVECCAICSTLYMKGFVEDDEVV